MTRESGARAFRAAACICYTIACTSILLGFIAHCGPARVPTYTTPVVKESLTNHLPHALSDNPFRGTK